MQCLTLFLLVGLGLASAYTSDFDGLSIDRFENVDETPLQVGGWIAEQLRKTLDIMAESFEKALEDGKTIREETYRRAEEIRRKLSDLGIEVSERVKEILERIGKEFEKKSAQGPVGNRLKEAFENLVTKMKEAVDSGKGIRGDLMKKAEDIYEKLKNLNVEISEKTRTMFEDLKSKFGRSSAQRDPEVDKLKEDFEGMVEGMKLVIDVGKGIPQNLFKMAEEMYEKLKNLNVEISDEVKKNFEEVRKWVVFYSVQSGPVGDRLKEAFENILHRMKAAFDSGKEIPADLMKKAEDILGKLKNLKLQICDKNQKLFDDLRSKMGLYGSVSQDASITNIFDALRRLKQQIKEKLDLEKLKAKVEELFGKQSGITLTLVELLNTKGEKAKQKILDWIDRVLPDKEERSVSEVYEKLRQFFKELQLDLKERFTEFGEWVKEKYEKGLEKGRTRAENIKRIAKEFLEDSRSIGKDMAEEALGFFREYKKDLGKLYENVVDKIGEILKS